MEWLWVFLPEKMVFFPPLSIPKAKDKAGKLHIQYWYYHNYRNMLLSADMASEGHANNTKNEGIRNTEYASRILERAYGLPRV